MGHLLPIDRILLLVLNHLTINDPSHLPCYRWWSLLVSRGAASLRYLLDRRVWTSARLLLLKSGGVILHLRLSQRFLLLVLRRGRPTWIQVVWAGCFGGVRLVAHFLEHLMNLSLAVGLAAGSCEADQPTAGLLALPWREGLLLEWLSWSLARRPLGEGGRSVHQNVLVLKGILLFCLPVGGATYHVLLMRCLLDHFFGGTHLCSSLMLVVMNTSLNHLMLLVSTWAMDHLWEPTTNIIRVVKRSINLLVLVILLETVRTTFHCSFSADLLDRMFVFSLAQRLLILLIGWHVTYRTSLPEQIQLMITSLMLVI